MSSKLNKGPSKKGNAGDEHTRIAIVNPDKCKPKKCKLECKRSCPVVRGGQECIQVTPVDKVSYISEDLCIGCGICTKKCPFGAITIINIPKDLSKFTTHRYGSNSFKLHRLPLPRRGQILGLVGANGTGKSTALKILQGKIKPNLGQFDNEPSWEAILRYFRGSEHQAYFQKLIEDKCTSMAKIQYVDELPRIIKGTVREILTRCDDKGEAEKYRKAMELDSVWDREIGVLSGGELQRVAIAMVCVAKVDVYMFDEPSSYLDIRQRLMVADIIRDLVDDTNYVIAVEHDLAVLDYMSDFICCLYGQAGAYGVVTAPFGVHDGINIFLDGFVPTENLRFREESLTFRLIDQDADGRKKVRKLDKFNYCAMKKNLSGGDFSLSIKPGSFNDSECIVLLGKNGTGKTTFLRILAGIEQADNDEWGNPIELPRMSISYKPQKIAPKFPGTVRELLEKKINDALHHPQFQSDVTKSLKIDELMDQQVLHLSGGELQRVAITLALGTPADVYLLDEPSAYLDSEQRLNASRVIKRFILHSKKCAFIVEHDFIMATYLADKVIVYEGEPGKACTANSPQSMVDGMNQFLDQLGVTIRKDPTNFRPRINKKGSVKDREQKESGNFFFSDLDGANITRGMRSCSLVENT
ncbi:ATP-binding cassette sub-family E [Perkinsela sp. CCAP 1560/4]|nr:ATP-binding cassette sub-family E [Perkinsela sp. CCAP 1560/4]|eukprot:KNH04217.1 ATP-binding cassette sub-family E [Perkinsela sp. CCAP 1560/4]